MIMRISIAIVVCALSLSLCSASFAGSATDILNNAEIYTDIEVKATYTDEQGNVIGNVNRKGVYQRDASFSQELSIANSENNKQNAIAYVKKNDGEDIVISDIISVKCKDAGGNCIPSGIVFNKIGNSGLYEIRVKNLDEWQSVIKELESSAEVENVTPVIQVNEAIDLKANM